MPKYFPIFPSNDRQMGLLKKLVLSCGMVISALTISKGGNSSLSPTTKTYLPVLSGLDILII